VQVATPPTASEFREGIIGVTLRPVSGAEFVSLITDEPSLHGDEHLLHGSSVTPRTEIYWDISSNSSELGWREAFSLSS